MPLPTNVEEQGMSVCHHFKESGVMVVLITRSVDRGVRDHQWGHGVNRVTLLYHLPCRRLFLAQSIGDSVDLK
jgi:hypothetical protein